MMSSPRGKTNDRITPSESIKRILGLGFQTEM